MSAFWGKADMTLRGDTSAFDPKATFAVFSGLSLNSGLRE